MTKGNNTSDPRRSENICVIGLGYVGLPLTFALGQQFNVVGCDRDEKRIAHLKTGVDDTGEFSKEQLQLAGIASGAGSGKIKLTSDIHDAAGSSVFVITVPTPLLPDNRPDLAPLKQACKDVAALMQKDCLVIVESTVYPGVTEEICAPILQAESGLQFNRDFFCGYSPERVNPADRQHPLTNIVKITAGSTPQAADRVDDIYRAAISAGTHRAPSIRVAEAAKAIENTQRDVNIALMNELAMMCDSLDINSADVFAACASKWNFLPFTPGLVGGHCIGIDPYYLCHKAQASGYQPNLILAARQINDSMGVYVADKTVYEMARRGIKIKDANVLILGFTFKENCPDPRNSRAAELRKALLNAGANVRVCDPIANQQKVLEEYGFQMETDVATALADEPDAVVFAVKHDCFAGIRAEDLKDALVMDVKGGAPRADWRL